MPMWYTIFIAAAVAYLLGNVNGAVVMSQLQNDDVRNHGSGNAGLTNYIRNYGSLSALYVIAIDMGKAALACQAGAMLMTPFELYNEGMALGGLFVILGHNFPILLGWRGGKGILSGVTVALMLDWKIGLFVFAIFLVAYLSTHYVSLGSVLSSGSFGFIYAWFHRSGSLFPILVGFILSGLLVWMHRGNIQRLLKGEERKTNLFSGGKKK